MHYELMVIGNTYQAFDAALTAGRQGMRVALLQPNPARDPFLDDVTGGLPQCRDVTDVPALSSRIPATGMDGKRFWDLARKQIRESWEVDRSVLHQQLHRYAIPVLAGNVRLESDNEAVVVSCNEPMRITADRVVLATGTEPRFPERFHIDGHRIVATDDFWVWPLLPARVCVVGSGDNGVWHAGLCSRLGAQVTLVNDESAREWANRQSASTWLAGVKHRPQTEVLTIESTPSSTISVVPLSILLSNGERLCTDGAIIAGEEVGASRVLMGESVSLGWDERGRLWCDPAQRTWKPNIRAAGTIAGFPVEARDMESGRRAVHQFVKFPR